jgi:mannose-6-phosphate isomerase-like protein (cupin superfamily)
MTGVYPFAADLSAGQVKAWVPHFLLDRETATCERLSVHVSGLLPGKCPHKPHVHPEEEFLIVLKGEASLVIVDGPTEDGARVEKVTAGGGVYYPPTQYHTIRNDSAEPIEYLMVKWVGRGSEGEARATQLFRYSDRRDSTGFTPLCALDGPALRLERMHTHLTLLGGGKGYTPHADPYDVALVILEGAVETLGQRVEAPALVWYDQGDPHGIRNVGSEVARYVVFELEAA